LVVLEFFVVRWRWASRRPERKSPSSGRSEEKGAERLREIDAAGGRGFFVAADVASRESLSSLLETVTERCGKVDILVNGAGVNSPTPLLDIEDEEFARILDINLGAILRSCQIFGKHMLEQGGGSIINVGSISGLGPLSRVFTYSASKAAVHNLSKNLAREWAEQEVRVNTIVPGFFPAEQNRKVLTEDRVAAIMGHTPTNRFGEGRRTDRCDSLARLEACWFLHHRDGNDRRRRFLLRCRFDAVDLIEFQAFRPPGILTNSATSVPAS
jgi:NAD(P)-dependent dehydrogenase (short-subunit alcohol dehydrogenase family)